MGLIWVGNGVALDLILLCLVQELGGNGLTLNRSVVLYILVET